MNAASCTLTLPSPALNRYAGEDSWACRSLHAVWQQSGVLSRASFLRGRGEGEGASCSAHYGSELLTQDLLVDNQLIVEPKAAKTLAGEHIAQLLGYLRASRMEHGLLINLGAPTFQIRKFALTQFGED